MLQLRKIRKEKGYTQEYVSKLVEISRAGYTNIENCKREPSVKTAKKIAKVLDFDWTQFYE